MITNSILYISGLYLLCKLANHYVLPIGIFPIAFPLHHFLPYIILCAQFDRQYNVIVLLPRSSFSWGSIFYFFWVFLFVFSRSSIPKPRISIPNDRFSPRFCCCCCLFFLRFVSFPLDDFVTRRFPRAGPEKIATRSCICKYVVIIIFICWFHE